MSPDKLPSLRPHSGTACEGHADRRTAEYPSIKLVLEQNTDKIHSHKAAWAFYHNEHKKEIDLLASSLEELRLLKGILSHEHQEITKFLASLLDEIDMIPFISFPLMAFKAMRYAPLPSSSTSGTSESLSPHTPNTTHEWQ
ncbi:hypothetical protein FSARC_11368 [Fusarium sarcochroum]|uniref:Uncharacterized protein n=1 Tax=Fusarium sarcochroum TaxID=1208366 RepID=A0A8H4TG00_9HYPO|nr:hypothetical protein FSARC_11368 [Fusarium sarcochroum]